MKFVAGFLVVFGLLLSPITIFGSSAALAQVQTSVSVTDIVGNYRVNGRNPDGSAYSGTLSISDDLGTAALIWKVGSRTYKGSGQFKGNILVVDWGDAHPVIYAVGVNGNLFGTWADGAASEKLTRR